MLKLCAEGLFLVVTLALMAGCIHVITWGVLDTLHALDESNAGIVSYTVPGRWNRPTGPTLYRVFP